MKTIYIKMTGNCNLNCKHCYASKSEHTVINVDKVSNWFKQYVSLLDDNEELEIVFHGGEPMLCYNEILSLLKKLNEIHNPKHFCITTNLMYNLNNPLIQEVFKNMNQISVSYDFGNIRFNSTTLAIWENNVKLLKEIISTPLQINVVLTNETLSVNPNDFVNIIKSYGFNTIHLERLSTNTRNKIEIPSWIDVDNWLCNLYNIVKNLDIKVTMFEDIKETIKTGILKNCRLRECSKNVTTIDNNGNIYGCPNTYNGEWIKGNLNTSPTDNIFNICPLELKKNDKCLTCEDYDVCNGDCYQLEWQGDICPSPRNLIHLIKKEIM